MGSVLVLAAVSTAVAVQAVRQVAPEVVRDRQVRKRPMALIDCRARTDYDALHIRGAESIPLFELSFLPLPKDRDLVLYCGGTDCNVAGIGARKLMDAGYRRVYVLREGLAGWQERGYPLAGTQADKDAKDEKK